MFTLNAVKYSKSNPYILIKFHQSLSDNIRFYLKRKLLQYSDCLVVENDISDLLMIANCVISQPSTVAYESVLYKKPHFLISKDLMLRDDLLFSWDPLIQSVDDDREAARAIDKVLINFNYNTKLENMRSKFLNNNFHVEDGNALNRVYSFLNSIH
jgi:CDP-glycerol glycerophosphotransferase (TagB/SpsB family)